MAVILWTPTNRATETVTEAEEAATEGVDMVENLTANRVLRLFLLFVHICTCIYGASKRSRWCKYLKNELCLWASDNAERNG